MWRRERAQWGLLSAGLRAAGFDVLTPRGTYFVVADPRPLGFDDGVDLAWKLPGLCGVAAVPVSVFCPSPDAARAPSRSTRAPSTSPRSRRAATTTRAAATSTAVMRSASLSSFHRYRSCAAEAQQGEGKEHGRAAGEGAQLGLDHDA